MSRIILKSEARNPKFETNSNIEKIQCPKRRNKHILLVRKRRRLIVWNFDFRSFNIVSNFEIRISYLPYLAATLFLIDAIRSRHPAEALILSVYFPPDPTRRTGRHRRKNRIQCKDLRLPHIHNPRHPILAC